MKEKLSSFARQNVFIDPPSIGSKDLSFDEAGDRTRQIIEKVVDETELGVILGEAEVFGHRQGATRIVIRAFVNSDLAKIKNIGTFRKEAEILLWDGSKKHFFVYYGYNNPERCSLSGILDEETKIMQNILNRRPKNQSSIFEQAKGFSLERLQGELSPFDHERLKKMYNLSFTDYPFNIGESIKYMVKSEDYAVYAARSKADGLLYAVCATEEMVLNIEGLGRFVMREMGDSAKMPQVNGLNAPLKLMLVKGAFEDGVDLVFCESRAALPAVNAVNRDIGMDYCGFLMQHTRIGGEGVDEKSPYGNMNVWALNKDAIQGIGQKVNY